MRLELYSRGIVLRTNEMTRSAKTLDLVLEPHFLTATLAASSASAASQRALSQKIMWAVGRRHDN